MFIKIWYDDYTTSLVEFMKIHYINDVICILTTRNDLITLNKNNYVRFEIGTARDFEVEQCIIEGDKE